MRSKEQTQLIKEAATIDVDGSKWRDRLDRWLDSMMPKTKRKWTLLVNSDGMVRWQWNFTLNRWEFCG